VRGAGASFDLARAGSASSRSNTCGVIFQMAVLIAALIVVVAAAYAIARHRRRKAQEDTARNAKLRRTTFVDGKPSYLRPNDEDSYGNFRSRESDKDRSE
jgi:hypothetical protein